MSNEDAGSTPPFPPQPPPQRQKSPMPVWVRILFGICGVIAMVSGIKQCRNGMDEMSGKVGKDYLQLLQESDKAIDDANKFAGQAQPAFQDILNDADKKGLELVRVQDAESARTVSGLFGKSSDAFKLAAKKLRDAIDVKKDAQLNPCLELKIKSYGFWDDSARINGNILQLVMDPDVPDMNALMLKVNPLVSQRDEAQKNALKNSTDANDLAKQFQKK